MTSNAVAFDFMVVARLRFKRRRFGLQCAAFGGRTVQPAALSAADLPARSPWVAAGVAIRFFATGLPCAFAGVGMRAMAMSGAITRRPAMVNAALSRLKYEFTFSPYQ